jgi:hypothetical protein
MLQKGANLGFMIWQLPWVKSGITDAVNEWQFCYEVI